MLYKNSGLSTFHKIKKPEKWNIKTCNNLHYKSWLVKTIYRFPEVMLCNNANSTTKLLDTNIIISTFLFDWYFMYQILSTEYFITNSYGIFYPLITVLVQIVFFFYDFSVLSLIWTGEQNSLKNAEIKNWGPNNNFNLQAFLFVS